jgi:hypothetical protein
MGKQIGHFSPLTRASLTTALRSCAMFAVVALGISSSGPGRAAGDSTGQGQAKPTAAMTPAEVQQRELWRKSMIAKPRPGKGCFAATYPGTTWHAAPCAPPQARRVQLPYRGGGTRRQTTGNGLDMSAQVTTPMTQAEGSFDSVSTTGEQDSTGYADSFGLQLNTDFFSTVACDSSPSPANCLGWEQFVFGSGPYFGNDALAYIQYWMLDYGPTGTTCPAPHHTGTCNGYVYSDGWCEVPAGNTVQCVVNSENNIYAGAAIPATSLAEMKVTGTAATGGGTDQICTTVGSTVQCANGNNYFPDLETQWQLAEFNVFGPCCGYGAEFNPNTTLVVRTSVDNGSNAGPGCAYEGFTAEYTNLSFFATSGTPANSGVPSLVFTESNSGTPPSQTCALAVSIGESLLTVTKSGPGTGTVTSSPAGIVCGATCSSSFSTGSLVTLSAVPGGGYTFTGWSGGGCSGTGTCTLTLNANTTVTATFGNGNPVPSLTSISPTQVIAGGPSFTLTVIGSNFLAGPSLVEINGGARNTTYVSSTVMTATILASDIATVGTPSITVFTFSPGGGASGAIGLNVKPPPIYVPIPPPPPPPSRPPLVPEPGPISPN